MEDQTLFRMFNPLSPTTRRTTRALQEIQAQQHPGGLLPIEEEIRINHNNTPEQPVTPTNPTMPTINNDLPPALRLTGQNITPLADANLLRLNNTPQHNPTNTLLFVPERRRLSGNFDDSLSQNPSPDEAAIQGRGRRVIPLTFSPDINHTPLRQQMQRAKLNSLSGGSRLLLPTNSQTRTSPRKRLTLTDTPPSSSSITCLTPMYTPSLDKLRVSPLTKKVKIENDGIAPEVSMKGLSHAQLVGLLGTILDRHPEVRDEVEEILPPPDLSPIEDRLIYLKKNIYKALPNTRLETKTDSMAYNRVSLHLLSFKRAVLDSAKPFLDGQQWLAVIDYTIMAWQFVKDTPVWDNPSHNNIRKSCFKSLAGWCMTALKKGKWGPDQSAQIKLKLNNLKADSDEIVVCLKYLEEVQSNNKE